MVVTLEGLYTHRYDILETKTEIPHCGRYGIHFFSRRQMPVQNLSGKHENDVEATLSSGQFEESLTPR